MKDYCPFTDKVCYSKVEAQTYVNAHKHKKLRYYNCSCNHWHLTSKEKIGAKGPELPIINKDKFLKYLQSE